LITRGYFSQKIKAIEFLEEKEFEMSIKKILYNKRLKKTL